MKNLWNKIEQVLLEKADSLKSDFFWRMRRLNGEFSFSQKDMYVEVRPRNNFKHYSKVVKIKADGDNKKYRVEVAVNFTKSVTDIECNSQNEFTDLLRDLVNSNCEPCQGVAFEHVVFNPDPASVTAQLQNLLLEEHWDTGNLVVRSRKCKMYGTLNETDNGVYVCDNCSSLMGDPLSIIKVEQPQYTEEDFLDSVVVPPPEKEEGTKPQVEGGHCPECDVKKNNLKAHLSLKHKWESKKGLSGTIKCCKCKGLLLPSIWEYNQHLMEKHNTSADEFPFGCMDCSQVFLLESHLDMHGQEKHCSTDVKMESNLDDAAAKERVNAAEVLPEMKEFEKPKFQRVERKCLECDVTVRDGKTLQNHFKKHHAWDPKNPIKSSIKCISCDGLVLNSIDEYATHMMDKHGKQFDEFITNCSTCLQVFFFRNHMTRHRQKEHSMSFSPMVAEQKKNNSDFRCPYCAKHYFLNGRLVTHIKKEHASENYQELDVYKDYLSSRFKTQNKPLAQCDVCKKWYKRSVLHTHKLVHTEGTLPCPICSKELRPISYKKHLTRHKKANSNSCLCSQCGLSFPTKDALGIHINKIHRVSNDGETLPLATIQCPYCPKKYSKQHNLNEHLAHIHLDTCKEICEVCGKKFPSKPRLESHMVTHTDQRFQCPHCTYSSKFKGTLNTHIRMDHVRKMGLKRTRNNILHCKICTRGYSSELLLAKHMRRHANEKVQCPLCPRGFVHKGNLRIHFKQHHGIVVPKGEDWDIDEYAKSEPVDYVLP